MYKGFGMRSLILLYYSVDKKHESSSLKTDIFWKENRKTTRCFGNNRRKTLIPYSLSTYLCTTMGCLFLFEWDQVSNFIFSYNTSTSWTDSETETHRKPEHCVFFTSVPSTIQSHSRHIIIVRESHNSIPYYTLFWLQFLLIH